MTDGRTDGRTFAILESLSQLKTVPGIEFLARFIGLFFLIPALKQMNTKLLLKSLLFSQ